jgi:hypothetical protein
VDIHCRKLKTRAKHLNRQPQREDNKMAKKPQPIKKFLDDVKEKLPEWLKEKKKEVKEILDELEEHVWDKAVEIAGHDNPEDGHFSMAIEQMGTPASIAREYKRRGTPKYFITEELWPYYTKTLGIVTLVFVIFNLIGFIADAILGDNFWEAFGNLFTGIFNSVIIIAFLVSLLFVFFSYEGYLPEDLGVKPKVALATNISELDTERPYKSEKALSIEKRTKKLIKPISFMFNGVFSIVFGILLLTQPIASIFEILSDNFSFWLRIMGIVFLVEGAFNLGRVALSKENLKDHQIILIMFIIIELVSITLLAWIYVTPEYFEPIVSNAADWGDMSVNVMGEVRDDVSGIHVMAILIIVFSIFGIIEKIVHIVMLEMIQDDLKKLEMPRTIIS